MCLLMQRYFLPQHLSPAGSKELSPSMGVSLAESRAGCHVHENYRASRLQMTQEYEQLSLNTDFYLFSPSIWRMER